VGGSSGLACLFHRARTSISRTSSRLDERHCSFTFSLDHHEIYAGKYAVGQIMLFNSTIWPVQFLARRSLKLAALARLSESLFPTIGICTIRSQCACKSAGKPLRSSPINRIVGGDMLWRDSLLLHSSSPLKKLARKDTIKTSKLA
jgi:hypothetical protein